MISIVTATYNHEKTLPKLFNSICAQKYKNFEWIVCDDGSKDKTWELVKYYQDLKCFHMEGIQQINRGMRLSRNLNNGLRHAQGNIIFIVMGDSYLDNNTLEILDREYIPKSAGSGVRVNVDDQGLYKSMDWRIGDFPLDTTIDLKGIEHKFSYLTGNSMVVDPYALKQIGYWPEEYEEYGRDDWCVFLRLQRLGVPLYMYNQVRVNHVYHGEGSPDSPKNVKLFEKELLS